MDSFNTKALDKSEVIRCEAEINNLWGELNTANIPHHTRIGIENKLSGCEEQFKAVLSGQASLSDLVTQLDQLDMQLAMAAIEQAQQEISKTEHTSSNYLALEEVKREVNEQKIKPSKARHEVKQITRHHS